MLFFCDIKICRDLRSFWKPLGNKKFSFGSKTVFLWQKVHYNMVYIAYYTELNWQICNSAQRRGICYKNSKNAPDENFCGHFSPRRKAANFCDKYQLCLWLMNITSFSHLSIHIFVHGITGCCFEIIVGSVGDFSNKAVRGARAVTGKWSAPEKPTELKILTPTH